MKVAIIGGTGLVATELIRQSLTIPAITSIVAVARKPIQLDKNAPNRSNFKDVIIRDYEEFTDSVKAELTGVDVCIWTVAITPFRLRGMKFAEVKRVCQDCTVAGLNAMKEVAAASNKRMRFIYMSAEGTPDDLAKKPFLFGDYSNMRGETEKIVLKFGDEHQLVHTYIVHPGMDWSDITFWRSFQANFFRATNLVTRAIPNISRTELAAAILDCSANGFHSDQRVVPNVELVRIGVDALARKAKP